MPTGWNVVWSATKKQSTKTGTGHMFSHTHTCLWRLHILKFFIINISLLYFISCKMSLSQFFVVLVTCQDQENKFSPFPTKCLSFFLLFKSLFIFTWKERKARGTVMVLEIFCISPRKQMSAEFSILMRTQHPWVCLSLRCVAAPPSADIWCNVKLNLENPSIFLSEACQSMVMQIHMNATLQVLQFIMK